MSELPTTLSAASGSLVYSDAPQHAGLVYRESLPVHEQLQRLGELHLRDKAAERRVRTLGWVVAACVLAGILALLLASLSETPAVAAGAVLIPIAIPLFIVRAIIKRSDLDDRKLHAARRVLDVLQGDLKPASRVAVKIDFGSYANTKPVRKQGGIFSSVKQFDYLKRNWLELRFTLADGTQLKVSATTQAKRKTKAKRKYTKIKDRLVERLTIVLTAPKGHKLNPQSAEAIRTQLNRSRGMRLASCKVKPRAAMFGFVLGPAQRFRARAGWGSSRLTELIDGDTTLDAVIKSYKATAATQRAA